MRRIAIALSSALLLAAPLTAQSKPNFSGKWVRDDTGAAAANAPATPVANAADAGQRRAATPPPPMGGGSGAGFNCGGMCTILQDTATLKADRAQGSLTLSSTFKLDGSDSRNQMPGAGGMTDVVTVARWDGNKITFTTKRQLQGDTVTSIQTLSMDGGKMVVESALDRGQGPQPGAKLVYRKQ